MVMLMCSNIYVTIQTPIDWVSLISHFSHIGFEVKPCVLLREFPKLNLTLET
jgi:uncharacterized membrane protein YagU involved in acid resistance